MNKIKTTLFLLIATYISTVAQPQVGFTFDDGSSNDKGGYVLKVWNQMILDKLDAADIKATFFTNGRSLQGKKGKYVFESWDNAGHQIANHTYSHPNYNSDKVTTAQYKAEILKQDTIIASYKNYTKLFRFPYLREGDSPEKVNAMRVFLKELGYQNGYVTIDNSDWYIDSRVRKRLQETVKTDVDLIAYQNFYVNHIFEVAQRSEALAYALEGRNVKHTLLLHHNLVSALFLDALINKFREEGWDLVSSVEAFSDPIYDEIPDFAGNGLLDAMAKDLQMETFVKELDEKFNSYPVESMEALGL